MKTRLPLRKRVFLYICFINNDLPPDQNPTPTMKNILFFLSFLSISATNTSQQIVVPSNIPEIVDPIIERWIQDAELYRVDYKDRLSELKSIDFVGKLDGVGGAEYYQDRIKISVEKIVKDQDGSIMLADVKWKIYHELGHHFRILDCYVCRYNIMSANKNDRALYLYRDEWLEQWLNENYFRALKDVKIHNQNHTHR